MNLKSIILKTKSEFTLKIDISQDIFDIEQVYNQAITKTDSIKQLGTENYAFGDYLLNRRYFRIDNIVLLDINDSSVSLTLPHGYMPYYKKNLLFEIDKGDSTELLSFRDFFDIVSITCPFEKLTGGSKEATILTKQYFSFYMVKRFDIEGLISEVRLSIITFK